MNGHETDSHLAVCLFCLLAVVWAVAVRVWPALALLGLVAALWTVWALKHTEIDN